MDQIRLDPQDKLNPPPPGQDWSERSPTPQTRQQNTLPPQDKKVPAVHAPPEDNFWNNPNET